MSDNKPTKEQIEQMKETHRQHRYAHHFAHPQIPWIQDPNAEQTYPGPSDEMKEELREIIKVVLGIKEWDEMAEYVFNVACKLDEVSPRFSGRDPYAEELNSDFKNSVKEYRLKKMKNPALLKVIDPASIYGIPCTPLGRNHPIDDDDIDDVDEHSCDESNWLTVMIIILIVIAAVGIGMMYLRRDSNQLSSERGSIY